MVHSLRIPTVVVSVAVLVTTALAGPASAGLTNAGPAGAGHAAAEAHDGGPWLVWGDGRPNPDGADDAYSYDEGLVPDGAAVSVVSLSVAGKTRTLLTVRGLKPHHTYGTHLHTNACAADPAAAGPHYQQRVGATTDPEFANAENEVWLDVRTNRKGAGVVVARNPWEYRVAPGSVVLHALPTSTDPDTPGQAGARVACVTLFAR